MENNIYKKDYPFFKNNPDIIFFDNASTALKPRCVIDAVNHYYNDLCVNAHRGDYYLSYKVDVEIEDVRKEVAKFIDCEENEVVFTSGSTAGMNLISDGYCKKILKKGDEILISELEHAANVLPWFRLAEETGAVIKYVELENKKITLESFKKSITKKTKIASFAYVSNVLGYKIPAKEMCEIAHENNVVFILDGAQATPHMKVSMKELDCDFYVFSAHKLGGPTGIGVLYGKANYLQQCDPVILGGGMNKKFEKDGSYTVYNSVRKFEAGTPHIEGILGLGAIIKYISKIGFNYIENKEKVLRDRALKGLKNLEHIEIYNEDNEASTITFNIKNVFAQDAASYFAKYNICLRAGQHCAKLIDGVIDTYASVRCSFYFYNTLEEVDKFIEVASKGSDFLDAYF